jgi:hypothetical protein
LSEVKKGSVTPRVTSCVPSGNSSISFSMISSWNAYPSANPGMIERIAMKIRCRSSERCSTSVASSSCWRRRGRIRRSTARRG